MISKLSFGIVLVILLVRSSNAWISGDGDDAVDIDLDIADDETDSGIDDNEDGSVPEEKDVEREENLRCAANFNRNLQIVLDAITPQNSTIERESRQDNKEEAEQLYQSMEDLELSQVLVPVLKILGSAAAANATAIDENYNSLPFAVKWQVTDLIKFTVDLLQTT